MPKATYSYPDLIDLCRACPLFEGARAVSGDGPQPADFLFIAEAPGATEDREGRPLVGPSGRLFNRLLQLADLDRADVRVDNVVRHRPPRNRTPKVSEIRACSHWTAIELTTTRPRVIVTVGASALRLFEPGLKLTKHHGIARRLADGTILVPWFHPAAALREPEAMAAVVGDAKRLGKQLEMIRGPRLSTRYESGRPVVQGVLVGFDTETTTPTMGGVFQAWDARILGYSLSWEPRSGSYIASSTIDEDTARIIDSEEVVKVLHNAKFEYGVLSHEGIVLRAFEDTMVSAYLLGEPLVGLKDLAYQYLGVDPVRFKDVVPKGGDVRDADPEAVVQYAAADADNTRRLWVEVMEPGLRRHGLMGVYREIELPLIPVLARAEAVGVKIDVASAKALQTELSALRDALTIDIREVFGVENPASSEQVARRLEALGAPIKRRTPVKRLLSTDDVDLRAVHSWNPSVIDTILAFRKYGKLYSYVENFVELTGADGRLHASFNQAGWEEIGGDSKRAPRTGRLSSSGPNLQNNPHHADEEWGRRIRQLFVAEPGYVVMSCDVSQEEPRIIAVRARDEHLLRDFANGVDIYRRPTEAIYPQTVNRSLSDSEWKQRFEHERFVGKTGFLAWYYGAGAARFLELDSAMGAARARQAVAALEREHPERRAYLAEVEAEARANGAVRTMFGRIIWAPEAYSLDRKVIGEGLRKWANGVIQGSGADILKKALVRIQARLDVGRLLSRMIMFIHDEVVLEVREEELDTVAGIVVESFQDLIPIALPVEINVGANWGEMRRMM